MGIKSQRWSKTEDGCDRLTTTYDDGSSRDVTRERDGRFTVTDHSASGESKTYDGAAGLFGTFASVTPVGPER